MKNLAFDFSVDKGSKTITVDREFDAPLKRVWSAWTESNILDEWWAPKPFRTVTKSMDFQPGGRWYYAMVGPENERHNCLLEYKSIKPQESYSGLDAFCDENGKINEDFPRSLWTVSFRENAAVTKVNIIIKYEKVEDLEKIIEMGFKEGFTMGMQNLDEYLAK